jgi:hypothetical protein
MGGPTVTDYKVAAAHLTPPEREWLKEIAEQITKTVPASPNAPMFVHIGVMHGGSLHCSRAGSPQGVIVGVDLNLDTLRGDPEAVLLHGDSMMLGQHWETPIHFLFMDGAHDWPSILLDIEVWARSVVVGGIMAFHDADYHHVTTAIEKWGGKGWPEIKLQQPGTPHTALRIRAFRRGAG